MATKSNRSGSTYSKKASSKKRTSSRSLSKANHASANYASSKKAASSKRYNRAENEGLLSKISHLFQTDEYTSRDR